MKFRVIAPIRLLSAHLSGNTSFGAGSSAVADAYPKLVAHNQTQDVDIKLSHRLSERQVRAVLASGVISLLADTQR